MAKIEREEAERRERTREATLAKYEDGKDAFRLHETRQVNDGSHCLRNTC